MLSDRFPNLEFYRVSHIVAPDGLLPISASSWWAGVKSGKYPKPVPSDLLGVGVTAWSRDDIQMLVDRVKTGDSRE